MCASDDDKKKLDQKETQPESFSDDEASLPDESIVYTDEELDAMRAVRARLSEEHAIEQSRVGSIFLAVTTINCKLRVEETATKINKLLELMEQLGCPDGIDDELWKPDAAHELKPYAPAGKDRNGLQTSWIRGGGKVAKEKERHHVQACIMQHMAIHADSRTLRNGLSFVIDVSGTDMEKQPKVGNEKVIQSFYQAIPQRPQAILIAGSSFITRTFINASIKLASLFIKQKILQRIKFVSVDEAKERLPLKSAPVYVGGKGGCIENYEEWVKGRLEMLPKPEL